MWNDPLSQVTAASIDKRRLQMKRLILACVFVVLGALLFFLVGCVSAPRTPLFQETGPFKLSKEFDSNIRGIAADGKGNLWVLAGDNLYSLSGTTWTVFNAKNGLATRKITCMIADPRGRVWVGTGSNFDWSGDGVFEYNGGTWTQFTTKDGLSSNAVLSLYEDAKGSLWAGAINGICHYDGSKWVTIRKETPRWWSRLFLQDRRGKLWIGEFDGLAMYDGTSVVSVDSRPVTALELDRNGTLYVGHYMGILSTYTGTGLQTVELGTGLRTLVAIPVNINYYVRLKADPRGGMWASSAKPLEDLAHAAGTFHYDGKSWRTVTADEMKLTPTSIYDLLTDPTGALWAIGFEGASRFDGKAWTAYTSGQINAAVVDARGALWVAAGKRLYGLR
jgi:hypothetical protein